ncbi:MAG TPA: glucoamylase family protein [Verrucomicrobiae bacterium]|nr:glucoamylase family protein [Verrucomicrobiae bacterium]
MRQKRRAVPICLLAMGASFFLSVPRPVFAEAVQNPAQVLSEDDRTYLLGVYKDTWKYIADHVEKLTGLPYDASNRQPPTSLSNIGFYLATTSIAYRTGLISAKEAEQRVTQCLDSLDKIEKWRGFPRPWVLIRTLQPTFGDEFTYGPHVSVLVGGLLVAESTFPEIVFADIAPRIRKMLVAMDFKSLYEPRNGWLKGGYNVKNQDFAVYQSWGHWYYKHFASEIRLLSYYMIARGLVPKSHWFSLIRPMQQMEGETFFVSGLEEGGLFVQYLPGLFLDERGTEMGDSQKAYAAYQIKHATKIGAPIWGWSSCLTPQGKYLAYGELRDDIVTPYASMLASIYFPKEAVENLKKMEGMGLRPKRETTAGEISYGFLDSVSWKTGDLAKHYLTPNQAMGFLSLANLLFDGVVWKSFKEVLPAEGVLQEVPLRS